MGRHDATQHPDMPISDVAAFCGFTSLAAFSRAFKQRFGLPPTRWVTFEPRTHIDHLDIPTETYPVDVRHIPAQRLAYVRVYDSYSDMGRITEAYRRLLGWFEGQGGDLTQTTLYGMSHNDPEITPLPNCYFDWCLTIPHDWSIDTASGNTEINVRSMPACDVAFASMWGGDLNLEARLWQYLWQHWLPAGEYQPDELPAMEIYRRLPHEAGWWDTLYLDCAIPVVPL
ncbi:MAG: AraC family transcriptional regulator [Caldilineaceae bacterium]